LKNLILSFFLVTTSLSFAQSSLKGSVIADGMPLQQANIVLKKANKATITDESGNYFIKNIAPGNYEIVASYTGFRSESRNITLTDSTELVVDFYLRENNILDEVVITGTLKPVSRLESPVPV